MPWLAIFVSQQRRRRLAPPGLTSHPNVFYCTFAAPARTPRLRVDCEAHGITVIAYPRAPRELGEGAAVDALAARCGRTRAQIMLRWAVDHRFAVVPLSTSPTHLAENFAVREFRLTAEQLGSLDQREAGTRVEHAVDFVNADFVSGWAFAESGLTRIQVVVDGMAVGEATRGLSRPDVGEVFADQPDAGESGFTFAFGDGTFRRRLCEVGLVFELADGNRIETEKTVVPNPRSPAPVLRPGRPPAALAPFPSEVLELLGSLRSDVIDDPGEWAESRVAGAIDDFALLVRRGSKRIDGLYRYLRFLLATRVHAEFVARHFPRINTGAGARDKDFIGVASTLAEMLCIANHLYVLKSRGLGGRLLEFGCFKGFSTACLSFACDQFGIGLDVFDSFQGLPASDSHYYREGEFAGSLPEVRRNAGELGRIGVVTFHEGFFFETLRDATVEPLCIWMDVDLESSSRDVMSILPALPRESCVFSHEIRGTDFAGGEVTGRCGPVGPIVDAHEALDRAVRGRFLAGNTGAFWAHGTGIPVLPYEQLERLLELA